MSIENPQTLNEWSLYVSRYNGVTLRSKAINVNTMLFINELLAEGKDMDYIKEIVLVFVRRMAAVGMAAPRDGMWDMDHLMKTDPISIRLWKESIQSGENMLVDINDVYHDPRTEPDQLDIELDAP